jgi:hypothetical protein
VDVPAKAYPAAAIVVLLLAASAVGGESPQDRRLPAPTPVPPDQATSGRPSLPGAASRLAPLPDGTSLKLPERARAEDTTGRMPLACALRSDRLTHLRSMLAA